MVISRDIPDETGSQGLNLDQDLLAAALAHGRVQMIGGLVPGRERGHACGEGWRKSSHSLANTHCVEATCLAGGRIAVRDSKAPEGLILSVRPHAWTAFTASLRQL
jgi:hypothetical protein